MVIPGFSIPYPTHPLAIAATLLYVIMAQPATDGSR